MRIGSAKQSYAADAALFDSRTQQAWVLLLAGALVGFPFFAGEYWLYLACLVAINIVSATGLNILTGYTGLVSLGQAAFRAAGPLGPDHVAKARIGVVDHAARVADRHGPVFAHPVARHALEVDHAVER